jgi:hypothetical protein
MAPRPIATMRAQTDCSPTFLLSVREAGLTGCGFIAEIGGLRCWLSSFDPERGKWTQFGQRPYGPRRCWTWASRGNLQKLKLKIGNCADAGSPRAVDGQAPSGVVHHHRSGKGSGNGCVHEPSRGPFQEPEYSRFRAQAMIPIVRAAQLVPPMERSDDIPASYPQTRRATHHAQPGM